MPQIALVSHQHDNNIGIGVIPQLLKPSCDVLVCLVLADVIDEQCADGASVVGRGDGAVALLAGSIPNLRLDGLGVDLNGPRGEFDADSGLGVEVELVPSESTQQIGLSDTRVSDQDNYKKKSNRRVSFWHVGKREEQQKAVAQQVCFEWLLSYP